MSGNNTFVRLDQAVSLSKATAVALTFLVALISGCTSGDFRIESQQLLAHQIVIPREYRWGQGNPHLPSQATRYLYAYDQAWWACISDFAKQIDYVPTIGDHAGNGWPPAVAGYADGYSDAEAKVREIKRRFGNARAQTLLRQALEYPE